MAGIYSATCLSSRSDESDRLTSNSLYQKDIISMADLSLSEINLILQTADKIKQHGSNQLLNGKIIAACFYEPSTRTRLSFETAVLRQGGQIIGFADAQTTASKKGESLRDSIQVVSNYADLVIIRHPHEGAARLAADITDKPVINAGDGANQHPTQTLIDLFTIKACQNRLDSLSVALAGDLKNSRTIHSLLQASKHYDMRLFLVSPNSLSLPEYIFDDLKQAGVRFSFHQSIDEVIPKVDILYMTRVQHERSTNHTAELTSPYILTKEKLAKAKDDLKILHPMPRINEIDEAVDDMPQAYYFQQAANGVYVRQAILSLLMNKELL